MLTRLESNLARVRARIAQALERSGRPAASVELVAVTKSVIPEVAAELCALGQLDLAENRADELERKVDWFRARGLRARWHFIGHVQGNKARRILERADVLHSVDSRALLERCEELARASGRRLPVYVQLKLSDEATKTGLAPRALEELLEVARTCAHVELRGLMTIAPLPEAADGARGGANAFVELAQLARSLEARPALAACFANARVRLSMGMSDDFEAAIAAGSDVLRIGSALFEGLEHERGAGRMPA